MTGAPEISALRNDNRRMVQALRAATREIEVFRRRVRIRLARLAFQWLLLGWVAGFLSGLLLAWLGGLDGR